MAPGSSSSPVVTMTPVSAPPSLLVLSSSIPSMGTLPSTSNHSSSSRTPLSRKRPNAAILNPISLIPSKKPLLPSLPSTLFPSSDELRTKRERHESESSSQSSVSSQGSSSDEYSSSSLASIDFSLESSSASSTPGSSLSTPSEPPIKQSKHLSHPATAREGRINEVYERPVVVEQQPNNARVIFCEKAASLGPHLEHGSIINGYQIIANGKDASAFHLETGEVYNARLITAKEFQTTRQVAERLEKADEMCAQYGWDVDELSDAVLPCEAEVVEQDMGSNVIRYILFTPFEYSNLHVMASNASATSNYGLPEERVADYFKQISRIIAFCHTIGIIVRDLKPRKLVFSNQSQTKIRLADVFDVAVCDSVSNDVVTEKFGSPAYIPPEVLTARSNGFAGRPADVWGLGVLTFLLLSGKYPFYDSNPRGVFKRIRRAHVCFPSGLTLSRSARDIVHCMLRKRPAERPDAVLLAEIPWEPVKDCLGTFRERVNHMISPHMGAVATLRRQRPIIIPSSDVLTEQVVPETSLRVTDDGIYVGSNRRGMNAVPSHSSSNGDRAVPTPFPLTRYPLNEWPYASEMESRLAIESRLPLREISITIDTRSQTDSSSSSLRQPAHLRI